MATTYPAVADKINMLHADGPCVCSAPGTYHFALGIAGAQIYPKQMFGMVKATNPGDAVSLEAQVGVSIFLDEVANVPEGIVIIGPLTASGFTTAADVIVWDCEATYCTVIVTTLTGGSAYFQGMF